MKTKLNRRDDLNLLKSLGYIVIGICIFGIFICFYTLHVESSKEKDSTYKAFCDFNQFMSCTKVFTSK